MHPKQIPGSSQTNISIEHQSDDTPVIFPSNAFPFFTIIVCSPSLMTSSFPVTTTMFPNFSPGLNKEYVHVEQETRPDDTDHLSSRYQYYPPPYSSRPPTPQQTQTPPTIPLSPPHIPFS